MYSVHHIQHTTNYSYGRNNPYINSQYINNPYTLKTINTSSSSYTSSSLIKDCGQKPVRSHDRESFFHGRK